MIYRSSGSFVGSLPRTRLEFLYHAWTCTQSTHPTLHSKLSLGSFPADVSALLDRHPIPSRSQTSKISLDIDASDAHLGLPTPTMERLAHDFHAFTHRFATPLNVPTNAISYHVHLPKHPSTQHPDELFGATNGPYATLWTGSSIAHPLADNNSVTKALKWAIMSAATSSTPTCTFLLKEEEEED